MMGVQVLALAVLLLLLVSGLDHRLHEALITDSFDVLVVLPGASVALMRVAWIRQQRGVWAPLGAALALWAVGSTLSTFWIMRQPNPPSPSLADPLFLSLYPLCYLALIRCVRAQTGRASVSLWLDGLIGALSSAAVAAALVLQPLAGASPHGSAAAVATNLAYPIGDCLLVAAVVGMGVLTGWRLGRGSALLVVGLVFFGAGDVMYLRGVSHGLLLPGPLGDLLWGLGFVLIALAPWWSLPAAGRQRGALAAVIPSGFALAAIGLLAYDRIAAIDGLAFALALAAVTVTLARLLWTVRSERRLWENRRLARTDDLTGLPNRRVLAAALQDAVGEPTGLAVIDLNGFKEVNDSFGHDVGDELLRVVSRRLHEAVRPEDVLVRLGGDEFAVLISGCNDISSAESVAYRLLRAFTDPFAVAGIRIRVGASAGVACHRVDTASAGELLRHADLAMYRAKAAHTGVEGHVGRRGAGAAERVALMAELGDGLSQGQIVPYYQPQVDIRTGHVVGAEALARWEHPDRGLLLPGSFVRAVEQTNLSGALTRSILERALSDCAAWKRDGLEVPVSVNLTAADIVDEAFPDLVSGALAEHGVAPDRLCLEITEHFVASDPARALAVLMRLGEQGVRLALDDYGIDRSSLSHLDHLPVNELKIDRSFVSQIVSNERTAVIVASTLGLAQGLGLRAVAEGVEDQETVDALRAMGSPAIQGFFIARPMSARSLPAWVRTYNAALTDHTPSVPAGLRADGSAPTKPRPKTYRFAGNFT